MAARARTHASAASPTRAPDESPERVPRRASPVSDLMRAQRDAGNAAVLRMLGAQPKLRVGPPDDEFEREADQVADRVMRMPATEVHRKCAYSTSTHSRSAGLWHMRRHSPVASILRSVILMGTEGMRL